MSILGILLGDPPGARATKFTGGNPQSPAYWVRKLFGGGADTAAGIRVDEDTVLHYSPVWNAINIIAGAMGFLPLHLYRRLPDGGKERDRNHPSYSLMRRRANPLMSAQAFREVLQGHALTWPGGYAEIERDNAMRPLALWPLRPDRTTPKMVEVRPGVKELRYEYITADGPKMLHWFDVLHIHGLGFDGITGYNRTEMMRESVGLGLAAEQYGARFFGNDARPGGVLEHPGNLGPGAKLRLEQDWRKDHAPLAQKHRLAVLEEGMKWHEIGIPPETAQFLETRKFGVDEVARWFNIPTHLLNSSTPGDQTVEHRGIDFVTWCLLKWFERWQQECAVKLLTIQEFKADSHFFEFLAEALLKADMKTRYQAHRVGIMAGWQSRNEVRVIENRNAEEGLDEFLVPLNMIPQSALADYLASKYGVGTGGVTGEPQEPPGKQKGEAPEDDRFLPLLQDTWRRLLTKEGNAIRRLANRNGNFLEAAAEFYAGHARHLTDVLGPVLQACLGRKSDSLTAIMAHRYVERRMIEWRNLCGRFRGEDQDPATEIVATIDTWQAAEPARLASAVLSLEGEMDDGTEA